MYDSATSHSHLQRGFCVSFVNRHSRHAVDENQLSAAVRAVLDDSPFTSANISVAVVDDETLHELNRQYLNHDWPTDVLSFVLDEHGGHLEGEVIISADTAAASAAEIGWPAAAEQLLYVVHGTLHLVGYRDESSTDEREMRAAEARFLLQFGLEQPPAGSGNSVAKLNPRRPSRPGATLR
jgi:probable rRNA maturation factor